MAGLVQVDGTSWTASSGLFYWVVDTVAEQVQDPATASSLRQVSEHNLGWLDPDDFGEEGSRQVRVALAALPGVAERELPDSAAREEVLQRVRDLAALAAGTPR